MTTAAQIFKRTPTRLIAGVRDCPICGDALYSHPCRQRDTEYFTCVRCDARLVLGPSGWFRCTGKKRPEFIKAPTLALRRTVVSGETTDGQAFSVHVPPAERKKT